MQKMSEIPLYGYTNIQIQYTVCFIIGDISVSNTQQTIERQKTWFWESIQVAGTFSTLWTLTFL